MNLCTNAIHAMKEKGGLLSVRCFEQITTEAMPIHNITLPAGHWVCIEVSDTGYGIPEEKLARIFDPFFTTKKNSEGTGLGLSVVLGIIKAWSGSIAVHSVKDKGTTFTVFVPSTGRKDRNADNITETSLPVLMQVTDHTVREQLKSAFAGLPVQWLSLRNVDDVPRLWRVTPWRLAIFSQAELDLPYEILVQQWRSQGIQTPFMVFSEQQITEMEILDRVAILPRNAEIAQIQTSLKKLL
jgi:hypothetical protein